MQMRRLNNAILAARPGQEEEVGHFHAKRALCTDNKECSNRRRRRTEHLSRYNRFLVICTETVGG